MMPAARTAASDDRGTLTTPSTVAFRRTDGTSSLFRPTATKSNASMKSNSAAPEVGSTTRSRESITNSSRAMRTRQDPRSGTITNKSDTLSTMLHRIEKRLPSSCRIWIEPKACKRAVARNASPSRSSTSTAAPNTRSIVRRQESTGSPEFEVSVETTVHMAVKANLNPPSRSLQTSAS